MNFQTASRNRFNIQWWEVPVQQGYAPFPFVSSFFVGVLYTYFPLFLPLPTPSPRQLRTQFLFFLIPPEFELLSKERQSRRSSREGDFERFFQNIILSFHSDLLSLTQQREREMLERRRRVSPNSVHVSGPNCFAFYAFRFAIPFHSSTSWIIDFQGDTTRGLTLLKITVGSILGRRASLQRGNKDRLLLLLLSLFPLFAEKYAVASTSEFQREGYRLCYKFLISRYETIGIMKLNGRFE